MIGHVALCVLLSLAAMPEPAGVQDGGTATAVATDPAPATEAAPAAPEEPVPRPAEVEAPREAAPTAPGGPDAAQAGGKPGEKPEEWGLAHQVALGILGVGLADGLLVAMSSGLAGDPSGAWVLLALSPIAAGSGSVGSAAFNMGFVGAVLGLGLYNVIELSRSHYTRPQRFRHNLVGFHVAVGLGAATQVLWGREAPSTGTPVAIGLGLGGDGPALLVGGRF